MDFIESLVALFVLGLFAKLAWVAITFGWNLF